MLQRLKESLYFWRRHLLALFLISAPFAVIGEVFQWLMGPVIVNGDDGKVIGFNAVSMLFLILLRPLAEGALIFQLSIIQRGGGQGPWHSVLAAFLRFPYLLATYFIMALAVSVGWMLLFFPAFWVYARLCFAPFRVMLRGDTPVQALRVKEVCSACTGVSPRRITRKGAQQSRAYNHQAGQSTIIQPTDPPTPMLT